MFRGEKSEQRAFLHVALRTPRGMNIVVDAQDVVDVGTRRLASSAVLALGAEEL